jgi:hypothetical protein
MGEYVNASIRFGGKLPAEHADELLELINEKHLGPDWDPVGEVTREHLLETAFYGDSRVNYGNLEELEAFCQKHGLWYEYECGSGPEWDGYTTVYNPVTGESHEFVGEQTKAITLDQVKQLGSYEAVLAYFDNTIPPFEIVGEFPEDD